MSFASYPTLAIVLLTVVFAAPNTSTSATVNASTDSSDQDSQPDSLVHWSGTQQVGIEKQVAQQTSKRIWILKTQDDWDAYCKTATWKQAKVAPKNSVDFKSESIVVFNNVKYVNRMSLFKTTYDKASRTLVVRLRETRTARPITNEYYAVAVVVPKDTAVVTDGNTRLVLK